MNERHYSAVPPPDSVASGKLKVSKKKISPLVRQDQLQKLHELRTQRILIQRTSSTSREKKQVARTVASFVQGMSAEDGNAATKKVQSERRNGKGEIAEEYGRSTLQADMQGEGETAAGDRWHRKRSQEIKEEAKVLVEIMEADERFRDGARGLHAAQTRERSALEEALVRGDKRRAVELSDELSEAHMRRKLQAACEKAHQARLLKVP
eukprot:jgi/Mesen1/8058/ME000432S07350